MTLSVPRNQFVRLVDVGDVPWDAADMLAALDNLSKPTFKALVRLRLELKWAGQLPVGIPALARVAKVTPAAMERMVGDLDRHLRRDNDGRWTDDAIIGSRGSAVVHPARELPPVDPHRSAVNKANGSKGGQAKARNAKMREAEGLVIDAEANAELVTEGLAKPASYPSDIASDDADFAASQPEDSLANASPAASLSVCLLEDSSEFSSKQTRAC